MPSQPVLPASPATAASSAHSTNAPDNSPCPRAPDIILPALNVANLNRRFRQHPFEQFAVQVGSGGLANIRLRIHFDHPGAGVTPGPANVWHNQVDACQVQPAQACHSGGQLGVVRVHFGEYGDRLTTGGDVR